MHKYGRGALCLSVCVREELVGVTATINTPPPPTKPSFVTSPFLKTSSNITQPIIFLCVLLSLCC